MSENNKREVGVNNALSDSFDAYVSSLEKFYIKYTNDIGLSLMRQYPNFDIDAADEENKGFIDRSLRFANQDVGSLAGESVILFHEPVIVSWLYLSSHSPQNDSGAVRLITYAGTDKKIIPAMRHNKHTGKSMYDIHDVVIGLIVSNRCNFNFAMCASFSNLLTDYKKLAAAHKALYKVEDTSKEQAQILSLQFDEIKKEINVSQNIFHSISADIEAREKEKAHVESSLENSKKSLVKYRHDAESINTEYKELLSETEKGKEKLKQISTEIELAAKTIKADEDKAEKAREEAGTVSASLESVKKELADAKRESNLTTLDMTGHRKETKDQLFMYYTFAFILLFFLFCVSIYIYKNGEVFASAWPLLIDVSAWDIILSRLPLITATMIILGGLSGALVYLIKHIVSLNTEKMSMLKSAIIAEQISSSIGSDSMTDEERLEFKRDTKIKLITQVFTQGQTEIDKSKAVKDALEVFKQFKDVGK